MLLNNLVTAVAGLLPVFGLLAGAALIATVVVYGADAVRSLEARWDDRRLEADRASWAYGRATPPVRTRKRYGR